MSAPPLSRRERQIMDVLHRLGSASAADVQDALADPPSYSAVRTHLRILEEKGHVTHVQEGPRYIYSPTVEPEIARQSALRHVVSTFFGGKPERAVAALLGDAEEFSDKELDTLSRLIDQARREGR